MAVATAFEVMLQYEAGVSGGGMVSTGILLGLTAGACSYARHRLVAHEINTPLTYVVTNLALLAERRSAPTAATAPAALVARLGELEKALAQARKLLDREAGWVLLERQALIDPRGTAALRS